MGQLPDSKERTDTHRVSVFSLAYSTKAYPLNAGTGSLHSKLYSSTLALSLATRHGRIWTPEWVSQTADLGLSAVWPGTVLAVPGFIGLRKTYKLHLLSVYPGGGSGLYRFSEEPK